MSRRLPAVALALCVAAAGCGYSLVGKGVTTDPVIKRIGVPLFKDRTGKPGSTRRSPSKVIEELLQRGRFDVVQQANGVDALVEGEIMAYNVAPIGFGSRGDGTTTQASRFAVSVGPHRLPEGRSEEPIWASENFSVREESEVGDDSTPSSTGRSRPWTGWARPSRRTWWRPCSKPSEVAPEASRRAIVGPDSYLAEAALERVLQAAVGDDRESVQVLRGDETTWTRVVDSAGMRSLFAERRAVVVRDADQLKGDGEEVAAYLDDPTPGVTLVLMAAKADKRKVVWKKIVDGATVHSADPLRGAKLRGFVGDEVRRRGLKLSADGIQELIDRTGSDLRRLMGEMEKLEAYADGKSHSEPTRSPRSLGRGMSRPFYVMADALAAKQVGQDADRARRRARGRGASGSYRSAALHRSLRQMRGARALLAAKACARGDRPEAGPAPEHGLQGTGDPGRGARLARRGDRSSDSRPLPGRSGRQAGGLGATSRYARRWWRPVQRPPEGRLGPGSLQRGDLARQAALVPGRGVVVDDALLRGLVDLPDRLREELLGTLGVALLDRGPQLADLGLELGQALPIAGPALEALSFLLQGRCVMCHSTPPRKRNKRPV